MRRIVLYLALLALPVGESIAYTIPTKMCIFNWSLVDRYITATDVDNFDWKGDARPDHVWPSPGKLLKGREEVCFNLNLNSKAKSWGFSLLVSDSQNSNGSLKTRFQWNNRHEWDFFEDQPGPDSLGWYARDASSIGGAITPAMKYDSPDATPGQTKYGKGKGYGEICWPKKYNCFRFRIMP